MILPFVREFFADVENVPAFSRAVARVRSGAGRIRVSGLTPTGKALFYSLLHRAVSRPLVVIVNDNRAVDELLPVIRSLADLTGALALDAVIGLPAYDVLPFENLSPHPEIQEARAVAAVEDRHRRSRNYCHPANRNGDAPAQCGASTPTWRGSFGAAR